MEKIVKTEEAWQAELAPDQYQVCRRQGTEPAFTGQYWDTKEDGVYRCSCCGEPLFDSATKFDSGSGWPSFWQPLNDEGVETQTDQAHGMVRTEVHCRRCDAHLGHVFPDGPKEETGLRYCINSLSLDLKARDGE
ncbi:MAG: peptide-methionine (R)-S-oxide reductase [Gammaproteobacteria bacterium]|nr:MAG: peptide-methionine (R)-S-oxide reductase [Gammaproteobacteria bacterium]RLA15814.1 MAG: peptide-methionine (R)-S-oxide reductase [Gammaproteobacteria bacterium]RLA17590.1 MAG: peptide-methionine (R)-S-oxide reductase [Gammaproteobacteria bacterium]